MATWITWSTFRKPRKPICSVLIRRQVIQRLAETFPTPWKKEEAPVWIHLSSELTLKQGFM